jgi:superfamily II DNA or RNA helicase
VTEPRRFSGRQHTALFLAADGKCERCRGPLDPGWHADHVHPWSKQGPTDVVNGQALCPDCNRAKGDRVEPFPRQWQQRFISKYHSCKCPDFLLVACPGAGKTLASAFIVRDLLRDGIIDRVLIVVPTAVLRGQWMKSLALLGIVVDGLTKNNGSGEMPTMDGSRVVGWVVTYASLYSDRGTHRILNSRKRTLAVLDEVHHLGEEASWGKAALEALEPCVRRLCLSGTPFRGKRDGIPFVEFDDDGYARYRDAADGTPYERAFDYSYGRALHDTPSPVRPIIFDQYAGDVAWLEPWTGEEKKVNLAAKLSRKDRPKANRHALDPRGDFLRTVFADADARLSMVQAEGDAAAKGLVLCIDTRHAFYCSNLLESVTGQRAEVAVSKDLQGKDVTEEARQTIEQFAASPGRWLVAVAMVSEGVDIPALRVGVWATIVRSPLRFRQGIGRTGRRTGLPENIDQTAYWFVPKDPEMVALADSVYEEVKLALIEHDDDGGDGPDDGGGDDTGCGQDELPIDAFRSAQPDSPSIHAPGLGAVDPSEATRIAAECGQPFGAVAAVLAAMAKMGMRAQAASSEYAQNPAGDSEADSYKQRRKAKQGQLESLLKQLTSRLMSKQGIPYSREKFGESISFVKHRVYGLAGFDGEYERTDIPQLNEAIAIAKKWWAEL